MSYNSLRNHFEVQFSPWQRFERIFVFALIPTLSFRAYFFVPGPLGDLKRVSWDVFGSTDSISAFKIIFVFRPKIDIWPRGKHMILG